MIKTVSLSQIRKQSAIMNYDTHTYTLSLLSCSNDVYTKMLLYVILLRYLNRLETFKVNSNRLTTLSKGVMYRLVSITAFDWKSNPVNCTCEVSWVQKWTTDNPNVMDYPAALASCEPFLNPGGWFLTRFILHNVASSHDSI